MRKIVGPILIGLGAFLLVVAVLAVAYAPGEVKRTPLGVDSTTKLEGQADRLGAGTRPIYALSITKSDDNVSTDDVVVFTNIACAVFDEGQERVCADGDDENALSLSTDVFATDRVTAEAVDVDALPDSAEPHEGLVNKWPFDAKQETYPYWDGVTGSAQDAVFEREDESTGSTSTSTGSRSATPRSRSPTASTGPTTTSRRSTSTRGPARSSTRPRSSSATSRTAARRSTSQIAFTDEQQAENVADAEDNIAGLDLLHDTVPLVGFIGGGPLLRDRPRAAWSSAAGSEGPTRATGLSRVRRRRPGASA